MTTETKKPSERITVKIPMGERAFQLELSGPALCDYLDEEHARRQAFETDVLQRLEKLERHNEAVAEEAMGEDL
ncbi:MAG TPA: hypothetical protein VL494_13580 [Steroidobacteraceae bacterium]|nr:hypothetical protein [Steroidobacteraceae bacterium]